MIITEGERGEGREGGREKGREREGERERERGGREREEREREIVTTHYNSDKRINRDRRMEHVTSNHS